MAFEIRDLLQLNDGTLRKPVWEVYDAYGSTEWSITRATFVLRHVDSGTIISQGDSDNPGGEVVVNNDDEDRAGNPIKTVRPTIDLRGTEAERGSHKLSFHIYLDTGEDDVIRQGVQIVNFEEVA
jgi:hypothetical protein